ncbi:YbaB/EbfC family nucleoid-associated protein [uncultured Tessaracoccus sp.]|uniref:YbaB/EbfC family nucleoid-associated protein n=1 Tax=uncultured Tessaracoccus sp. TaxID=905023 RepID=UPI0025E7B9C3|nr:YbaB/EbfC family nucleoid-associated protein [uncultured Tessaracoccus sp.]
MFGDGFDMNALMQQAQKLQEDMAKAQEEMASRTFSASAGGDLVSLTLTGQGNLESITIKPEALEDAETLQDLIIAAFRSAKSDADQALVQSMPQVPGLGM